MGELSDEMLMAYADGELATDLRAVVEARVAEDAEARERLRVFEATGTPVAELFSETLHEPVPAHLLRLVLCDEPPSSSAATVRPAGGRLPGLREGMQDALGAVGRVLFGGSVLSLAVAWSAVALVLVGGAGLFLHHAGTGSAELVALRHGQIFAQGELKQALETTPSGTKFSSGAGAASPVSVQAVLTFRNRHQAYCRQYDAVTPDGGYSGIACRDSDGQWRLELHMAAATRPVASAPSGRITPAGKVASSVEAAVRDVIEGDALGTQDEQALIRNSWRP